MQELVQIKDKTETTTNLKMTGAEAVMHVMLEEQVETVFGYPGGAIMPVYDALYDFRKQVHHVLARHEQGAIHAAQGFARSSGKTGVVFATSGPGATNLITGLADAMIDSTPLVCITGQVHSHLLGTDAFQETDVMGVSMPVTKWNVQVTKAEDIPVALAKAFYIANSGRPGPVVVDITKDAQFESLDFSYERFPNIRSYRPMPELNQESLEKAAELINHAKKPFMVFGQGVMLSHAENELKAFLEKTGMPAASTLLGLGALPTNHPLYTGMVGMHGNYAPNRKTNECDLLIGVGMRFDDRVTGDVSRYAKQAKIVHIDLDKAELNKIIQVDVPVHADAKQALEALTSLVETKTYPDWLAAFEADKNQENQELNNEPHSDKNELLMNQVLQQLSKLTNGEAVVVTDVGQHQMKTALHCEFKNTRSHITSGGLGTMGFALPAAIGAKVAQPNKPVVAVIGDGGFQMTLQELGTLAQENLNLKVVVLNNGYLGMVRQWQELFYEKRYSFTEIQSPNLCDLGKAYGVQAKTVANQQELNVALREMLKSEDAFLLEVKVEREDNVFPMVPSGASVSEIRLK